MPWLSLLVFLVVLMSMQRTVMALSATKTNPFWSEVAITTANFMTTSQRQKLQAAGALDIERPVIVRAERINGTISDSDVKGSKIIHFQRHGEGYHNLLGHLWREMKMPIDMDSKDMVQNPFVRPEIVDAPLTEMGRQQGIEQRRVAAKLSPQLVVVSPLQRAIQTALLSFADWKEGVPWMAHEGCREELGLLVCNKRRPLSDIQQDYPHIDFSLVESEEDTLFLEDRRETLIENSERIYDFLVGYIRNRPEKEIAVVGHSAWLFTALNAVIDCGDDEALMSWFLTSEIRSMRMTFSEKQ